MSKYKGDFNTNATVEHGFSFSDAAGSATDPTTAGTIRVYKGSSTTERTSSSGITYTTAWDGVAGQAHVSIDTSDNTDAGFYAAGNDYKVVLVGAVVDGVTVNETLFTFSIENRNHEQYPTLVASGTVNDGAPGAGGFVTTLSNTVDDGHFAQMLLVFINGSLAGQGKPISAYTASTRTATISPAFTSAPSNGDAFVVLGRALA